MSDPEPEPSTDATTDGSNLLDELFAGLPQLDANGSVDANNVVNANG